MVRLLTLSVEGLDGARVEVPGLSAEGNRVSVPVGPDTTQEVRALVFAPAGAALDRSTPVTFRIVDPASGEAAQTEDFFKAP